MGNVHPYPGYLSREPSLHGHPAPLKKYGLISTHPGCKSAIKRTVHLLLCHAKMLIPGRFLQPTNPSPLPCCSPTVCHPHPGQKKPFTGELHLPRMTLHLFSPTSQSHWTHGWDRSEPGFWLDGLLPAPSTASAALPHPHFPLSFPWGLIHSCPQAEPFSHWPFRAIFFTWHYVINFLLRWQE